MARGRDVFWVTILNGGTVSGEAQIGHRTIVGIQSPAAWTTGDLTFQALVRQVGSTKTFGAVFDSAATPAAAGKITGLAADTYYALTTPLRGLGTVKVVSSVTQGADRVIGLVAIEEE